VLPNHLTTQATKISGSPSSPSSPAPRSHHDRDNCADEGSAHDNAKTISKAKQKTWGVDDIPTVPEFLAKIDNEVDEALALHEEYEEVVVKQPLEDEQDRLEKEKATLKLEEPRKNAKPKLPMAGSQLSGEVDQEVQEIQASGLVELDERARENAIAVFKLELLRKKLDKERFERERHFLPVLVVNPRQWDGDNTIPGEVAKPIPTEEAEEAQFASCKSVDEDEYNF
jgi:hypothetical protein